MGENGERIYDTAMTHLKHIIKEHGEYLLTVSKLVKRRNLIKQQFKQSEAKVGSTVFQTVQTVQTEPSESTSPLKAAIDKL